MKSKENVMTRSLTLLFVSLALAAVAAKADPPPVGPSSPIGVGTNAAVASLDVYSATPEQLDQMFAQLPKKKVARIACEVAASLARKIQKAGAACNGDEACVDRAAVQLQSHAAALTNVVQAAMRRGLTTREIKDADPGVVGAVRRFLFNISQIF